MEFYCDLHRYYSVIRTFSIGLISGEKSTLASPQHYLDQYHMLHHQAVTKHQQGNNQSLPQSANWSRISCNFLKSTEVTFMPNLEPMLFCLQVHNLLLRLERLVYHGKMFGITVALLWLYYAYLDVANVITQINQLIQDFSFKSADFSCPCLILCRFQCDMCLVL